MGLGDLQLSPDSCQQDPACHERRRPACGAPLQHAGEAEAQGRQCGQGEGYCQPRWSRQQRPGKQGKQGAEEAGDAGDPGSGNGVHLRQAPELRGLQSLIRSQAELAFGANQPAAQFGVLGDDEEGEAGGCEGGAADP